MRVLVLWDNDTERRDAMNLGAVLEHMAPQLAVGADVQRDGTVTVRKSFSMHQPKVLVRVADRDDYVDQLSTLVLEQP